MAQRLLYQEPLPVFRGGTGLKSPVGVLAGSTAKALRAIIGTDESILRSNGSAWEYGLGGRLIQCVISSYATQVSTASDIWVATGLTGQITPKLIDSRILVIARQNGVGRLSNAVDGVGGFRLVWNGTPSPTFGYPFCYQAGAASNLAFGTAIALRAYTPGNLDLQTFSTQMQSQSNNASQIITQWGNIASSSMLLLEVAAT